MSWRRARAASSKSSSHMLRFRRRRRGRANDARLPDVLSRDRNTMRGSPLSDSSFDEDLPQLAAESFVLSKGRCRSCGRMHALWPYIRLARASTGIEAASSRLQSVLTAIIAEGRRNILIAGAADTGLL